LYGRIYSKVSDFFNFFYASKKLQTKLRSFFIFYFLVLIFNDIFAPLLLEGL
jgi:tryptophan-rich sensory protein